MKTRGYYIKKRLNLCLLSFLVVFLGVNSLLLSQEQQNQNQNQNQNQTPEQLAIEAELKWDNEDYRPYTAAFNELVKLSNAFAKNKLRLALSNFQTGKSIIVKMREGIRRLREESIEKKHLNEKWYWQTIDRKTSEERQISNLKQRSKLKAVTYFTKAIHQLDEIHSKRIRESDKFKNLLSIVYLEWVLYQYDLGNLPQCVDILERYIALDPKYEREIAPHKYLASAYGFKERVLEKYNAGTEQERLFYKKRKTGTCLEQQSLNTKKILPSMNKLSS